MKSILRQLQELADADLYALCEAVDMELQRREEVVGEVPDSARRRAMRAGAELPPPQRGRGPAGPHCRPWQARPGDVPPDRVLENLIREP